MGLALARAFRAQGASVFLVCGPGIDARGFAHDDVVSARDMLAAARRRFRNCEVFVSCAAVADYRPAQAARKKLPRGGARTLRLVPNPDILATISKERTRQYCVGFSLENSTGAEPRAREKMRKKGCDLMVLNSLETMGSDRIRATLLFADGRRQKLGRMTKERCAQTICRALLKRNEN